MSDKDFFLKTPDLGDTEKIELIQWLCNQGDQVSKGQELIELVTDKAAFPVESPYAGLLKEVRVKAGSVVKKGKYSEFLKL